MADNLIQQALSRGYSIDEIANKLSEDAGFAPDEIRSRGYSSQEIIGKLGYEMPAQKESMLDKAKATLGWNTGRDVTVPDSITRDASEVVESDQTAALARAARREAVPEMSAKSLAQDATAGLLQIAPTAIKGVADIGRLVSGDRIGVDTSKRMKRDIETIQKDYGSERSQAQRRNFEADMRDENVGAGEVIFQNPGALSDQILPTLGSMFLPVGAVGAAGKLATVGKAAQGLDKAALAARVAKAQEAAGIGATAAQNSADTFVELLDKGVSIEDAYKGAAITVPFSVLAGKLTGGGAETALGRAMTGTGAVETGAKGLLKAAGKEGAQEVGEELGQISGEAVGTGEAPTMQTAAKRMAVAGTLGAVVGGGVNAATPAASPFQDFADAVEGTNFNPDATARDAMLDQVQSIDPRLTRIAQAEQTKTAAQQAISTAPTIDAAVDAFNVATAAGSSSMVDQSQLLNDVNEATNASIAEPLLTVPAQPTTTKPLEQTPVAMPIPKEIASGQSIESLRQKMEAAEPFTEESAILQEHLQLAVTADAVRSIRDGSMPVYQVSQNSFVTISPSAQNPGKFQVTRYNNKGVFGDSQYNTIEEAIRSEGLWVNPRLSEADAGALLQQSLTAESEFQSKKSEPTKQQKPKKDRKAVYPEEDSALVAIAKLGGMDTQQLLTNGFDQKDISVLSRGKTIGKRAMQTGGKIPKNAGQIGKGSMRAKQVGFNMPIHRNGGMSFDGMREALVQYGYLPEDASVNDAIELLRRELRGEPVYTASAVQAQAEAAEADRQAMMEAEQEANEASGYDELQGTAEERYADALIEELYGEEVAALARGMRVAGLTEEEINAEIEAFNQRTGGKAGAGQSQERSGEGRAEESGTDAEVFGGKESAEPDWLKDDFGLEGQTNEEAAAEYKQQQAEATKQEAEPPAKNVTVDQVDIFNEQGGLRFSKREDTSNLDTALRRMGKFVDEFVAGKMKDEYTQLLGDTPIVLQHLGAENIPFEITGSAVNKIAGWKHGKEVSADMLRVLPNSIYDPLAVFNSPDEFGNPGMVILTDVQSETSGEPVIVAVHLSKRSGRYSVNRIASAYELKDATTREKVAPKNLLYVKSKEGLGASTTPSLLLLADVVQKAQDLGIKIATEDDVVKQYGSRYSFAGTNAATADTYQLSNAQNQIASGVDPETVRKETGWFQGADGKWRFEISDADVRVNFQMLSNLQSGGWSGFRARNISYRKNEDGTYTLTIVPVGAKQTSEIASVTIPESMLNSLVPKDILVKIEREEGGEGFVGDFLEAKEINQEFDFDGFNALPLSDVIDHPALFAAYPALKDVMVQINKRIGRGAKFSEMEMSDGSTVNVITLGALPIKEFKSALLHEIQHGIQTIEVFATGGSVNPAAMPDAQAMNDAKVLRMRMDRGESIGEARSWFLNNLGRYAAAEALYLAERYTANELGKMPSTPEDRYKRLAGEVEARNTQSRLNMTDAERRATPPSQTADVADSDVIVVFNGKEMAFAPIPSNAAPAKLPLPQQTAERLIASELGSTTLAKALVDSGRVTFANSEAELKKLGGKLMYAKQAAIGETINIDGVDRPTTNSNGKPIAQTEEGLRNFWRWFGESRVVDAEGRPLVVYHGTDADFSIFRVSRGDFGYGVYTTSEAGEASDYANDWNPVRSKYGANVMPVYVSLQNPYYTTPEDRKLDGDDVRKKAEKLGHDGIIRTWKNSDQIHAIAFNPTQIKSATGNRGTFDGSNPDIRKSQQQQILGATLPDGRIILNLGALTEQNFAGVLKHEGFHSTVKELVGEETWNQLMSQLEQNLKLAKGNDWVTRANAAIPADTKASDRTEEIGAYAVEQVTNGAKVPNFIKRWVDSLLSAIRTALIRGMGGEKAKLWAMKHLKPQDLANLAIAGLKAKARNELASQGRAAMAFSTAFGPESQHRTPLGDVTEIEVDGVKRPALNSNGKPIHWSREGVENFWRWFSDSRVTDEQGRPLVVYHGTAKDFTEFDLSKTGESTGNTGFYGAGAYFSEDGEDAGGYALWARKADDDAANVIPAYLALKDPLYLHINPKDDARKDKARASLGRIIDQLLSEGYFGKNPDKNEAGSLYARLTAFVDKADFERFMGTLYNELKGGEGVSNLARRAGFDGVMAEGFKRGENFLAEAVAFNPTQIKSATGINGDFDGSNPDIRYSKASPAQPAPLPEETKAQAAQRKVQDKFNRFTVIKDWLKGQGVQLSEQADVYKAEERMHSRFANKVEDFRTKLVEPLIKKIQAAGFSMDDVSLFLHAQHAEERNNQIAKINPKVADGSGMSTADANNVLAAAPAELKALANEFRQITEMTKQTLLDAGIISQDMVNAWEGAYSNYVPLKGGPDEKAKSGTGKGLHVNGKMKRALGHGKREGGEWIVENILADYERAVMLAEKNRVGHHLVRMALEAGRDDLITLNKPEKRAVLRNDHAYELRYHGSLVSVFSTEEAAKTAKTMLGKTGVTITKTNDPSVIYSASPMLQDNEANVYVNGHAIRVQINDELLARAYKNLGAEPLNAIFSAGRMLNGYLSKAYTGYNPEFILTNIVRDFTTGLINITGEEGALFAAKAAKNYVSSFGSLLKYAISGKETQWIKDYRDDGGNTGAAYLSDLERLGKEIKTEYDSYKGVIENMKARDGAGAARAAGRNLFNVSLKWIEHLNQAGENAMRLSIYRAAIESGKTRAEAASLAKNSTVNFNRKGELGANINALYLFFNAGVQGTSALAHAHFKGKHKYQALALSSGMIGLGFLAAAAFGGGDEDDYDRELSDYDKSRNLVIRAGDSWVKIPVPYGYGFFYNLGRHLADAERKGEWNKMPWHLASDFVGEFTPFSGVVAGKEPDMKQAIFALPTVAQIPGALMVNRTGMGSPIFPENKFDENQPDHLKMWRNTKGTLADDLAQVLDKAGLQVSPETLKYLGRTATGGSGAFVGSVFDAGKLTLEGADIETKEMPFVRKFVKEGSVSDYRSAFYEAKSEASKAADDFARAKKMGDMMSAKKLMEDNGELIAMDKYADRLSKMIKAKRDMQDVVKQDEKLTVAEKRLKLKALELEEQKVYDRYLDIFKQRTQERRERLAAVN